MFITIKKQIIILIVLAAVASTIVLTFPNKTKPAEENKNPPNSAENAPPGSIHNLPVPPAVAAARAYAAKQAEAGESEVLILTMFEKEWPNSCLGFGEDICAQVITPGWEVTLMVKGQKKIYRTDKTGSQVREVK